MFKFVCLICGQELSVKFVPFGREKPEYVYYCKNNEHRYFAVSTDRLFWKNDLYNFINPKSNGMGYYLHEMLKQVNISDKLKIELFIKYKMYDILAHYVGCRVGGCFAAIFRYILIPYLEDVDVLSTLLKSHVIEDRGNIIVSENGEKIYYSLYYDFMLVKSTNIKAYLIKTFPRYYESFIAGKIPSETFTFIDYVNQRLIEEEP